jgi:nucleotide-binding universal stress UspA family protein
VLGAKGRSAFGDLLLGSVSQRVASTSKLPVTLIK